MALPNSSEVQSQLASLVEDATRLESQLHRRARPGQSLEELKPDKGSLPVFQEWLQTELHALEERLRAGLVDDLRPLLRQWTPQHHADLNQELPGPARLRQSPPAPDSPPARLFEEGKESALDLLPGTVRDESSNPRTRKNLQFAGDDGEDVVARNRPAEIHVGLPPTTATAGGQMCPVVPEKAGGIPRSPQQRKTEVIPQPWETPFGNLREFVRGFFVENTCFGYVIISFIALNSLMMGIQADWMVTHIGEEAPVVFDVLEYIFAVVFTWELLMRIFVYNISFLRMPDWKWNIFDSVVVFLQVFDIITTLAIGGNNGGNLNFMRLVRLMRLLRILRLMRVLRFVQELRSMVMSIAASLRSLMWTIILLAFLMYGVGVCLIQLIADKGLEDPRIMENAPEIKLYYGSLVEALVSLFAGITGGIDWNDLLVPLESQIGPWLAAVFILYIAFAVLAMMNVVTGIFVESALQSTRADEEKEVRQQLQELFSNVDAGHDGLVCWEEFVQHLEKPDMMRCFESLGFNINEAYGLFNLLDTEQSGNIECEELLEGCLRLRGPANAIDVATLQYSSKRVFEWWRGKMHIMEELLLCIFGILDTVPGKDADEREHLKAMIEKVRLQQNSGKETRVFETWKKFKHK